LLLDRGYPSYELIDYLQRHYQGYWLIRCPASATFPAVECQSALKFDQGSASNFDQDQSPF
jgi:hypothetical protein